MVATAAAAMVAKAAAATDKTAGAVLPSTAHAAERAPPDPSGIIVPYG